MTCIVYYGGFNCPSKMMKNLFRFNFMRSLISHLFKISSRKSNRLINSKENSIDLLVKITRIPNLKKLWNNKKLGNFLGNFRAFTAT